jgi:hypothetical protein
MYNRGGIIAVLLKAKNRVGACIRTLAVRLTSLEWIPWRHLTTRFSGKRIPQFTYGVKLTERYRAIAIDM